MDMCDIETALLTSRDVMLQMSIINPDSAKRKKAVTNLGMCLSMAGCHSHHYRTQHQLAISKPQKELLQPDRKKNTINIQHKRATPASEFISHFQESYVSSKQMN